MMVLANVALFRRLDMSKTVVGPCRYGPAIDRYAD